MQTEPCSKREAGGVSPWVRAHQEVLDVALLRAGLERREGACLLEAFRQKVHRYLGYGGFDEYTDRHLGYGHRTTQDKLRTAEALEHLPELARAQREGRLHASAVRELARVATPQTEAEWVQAAHGRRVREIERLVARRGPGDRPTDAPLREHERHVLRFEVSGETLAAFRDAMQKLRKRSDELLDDDAALLMMARGVLCGAAPEGEGEPAREATGHARYQIAVTVCERCQQGFQQAGADQVAISPAMQEAASCDASVVHDTHVGAEVQPVQSVKPTHTIPPAVRRRVLARDQQRCQVSGCRNTLDVDVHHIQPRAEGGCHTLENLVAICGAHHRAVHAGHLELSGTAPHALVLRHADGTAYGGRAQPADVDVSEKVFRGLRGLGFRETEAKRALARALASPSIEPLTAQELLKRALAELAPRAAPHA
jgi:5-methylcytosine-specific restriction endonuclease McrA